MVRSEPDAREAPRALTPTQCTLVSTSEAPPPPFHARCSGSDGTCVPDLNGKAGHRPTSPGQGGSGRSGSHFSPRPGAAPARGRTPFLRGGRTVSTGRVAACGRVGKSSRWEASRGTGGILESPPKRK